MFIEYRNAKIMEYNRKKKKNKKNGLPDIIYFTKINPTTVVSMMS